MHIPVKPLQYKHPDIFLEECREQSLLRSLDKMPKLRVNNSDNLIRKVIEMSYDLTGEVLTYDNVKKLFIEAEEVCGKKLGIAAALTWANNFEFPPDVGARDTAGVKSHQGCLISYVKSIHERDTNIRLNLSRISKLIPTSDETENKVFNNAISNQSTCI